MEGVMAPLVPVVALHPVDWTAVSTTLPLGPGGASLTDRMSSLCFSRIVSAERLADGLNASLPTMPCEAAGEGLAPKVPLTVDSFTDHTRCRE